MLPPPFRPFACGKNCGAVNDIGLLFDIPCLLVIEAEAFAGVNDIFRMIEAGAFAGIHDVQIEIRRYESPDSLILNHE